MQHETVCPAVIYAQRDDVLYISWRPGVPAAKCIDDGSGLVRRYDAAGVLISATILDPAEWVLAQIVAGRTPDKEEPTDAA